MNSPYPAPSGPRADLATADPYQLLLTAVQTRDYPIITSLLQREDVNASLASRRSSKRAIQLLVDAISLLQMDVLSLLLGLPTSYSSVDPTTEPAVTNSMNTWPGVFRAALLSQNGGDVLLQMFMTHRDHEENLIKVLNVLLSAMKKLAPKTGAKVLLNQTIHTPDLIFRTIVDNTPLDFTLNRGKILPSVTVFLVRNGADTSRSAQPIIPPN